MTPLDWALEYWDYGYSLIPLVPASKKPMIAWKKYQQSRATREEVLSWWQQDPCCNIGLVCGRHSGLVVIDADDKESETYMKIHLDPTPMRVRTRKGVHFYYRHPAMSIQSKARVALAIDKRADGGLATGLGSVHSSGFVYCLDDGASLVSIRDLPIYKPAWFPEPAPMAPPKVRHSDLDASSRAQAYVDAIEGVGSGQRNEMAYRVAAVVVRDFAQDPRDALAIVSSWNDRCDPPLPLRELADICKSAQRSGRRSIGCRLETTKAPGGSW